MHTCLLAHGRTSLSFTLSPHTCMHVCLNTGSQTSCSPWSASMLLHARQQVPLEIASCWGGGTGASPSTSHTRADRGLGLGLGSERPLSLSLPTRQTPAAALGSAFSPSGATDPCLRSDAAVAAAAAAAGLASSPHMPDRLPNTLSDPTTSPWCVQLARLLRGF